jgi:hypothetical protein
LEASQLVGVRLEQWDGRDDDPTQVVQQWGAPEKPVGNKSVVILLGRLEALVVEPVG